LNKEKATQRLIVIYLIIITAINIQKNGKSNAIDYVIHRGFQWFPYSIYKLAI
jgi:hypothetical protein